MSFSDICSNCDTPLPLEGSRCTNCQADIGFPNVRLANKEVVSLQKRYDIALNYVERHDTCQVANQFEALVEDGHVVMARSVNQLITLVESHNSLISTYHQQVYIGARKAQDNAFDPKRDGIESLAHPLYYRDIHYAVLSLNGLGVDYYGDVYLKLDSRFIQNRTTFFEENPFHLVSRLKLKADQTMPQGYRASWSNKAKLAICKHHAKLKPSFGFDDLQQLLVNSGDSPDFIEANIYGNISVKCIDTVTVAASANDTQQLLLSAYRHKFVDLGIQLVT